MRRPTSKKVLKTGTPATGFRRKSTHEQLAETIEHDLRRGVWKDVMPSIRKLTKHYGSNLVTTFKASQALLSRGALVSQGLKRRHSINPNLHSDRDQPGFNKVALIVAASKKVKKTAAKKAAPKKNGDINL